MTRQSILLAFAGASCFAQIASLEMTFEGANCAPCVESMPARALRIRGVESAKVDAVKGALILRFAADNRVRVEQIRDLIQQDGTKAVRAARIEVGGVVEKAESGAWMLRVPRQAALLELKTSRPLAAGAALLATGAIDDLRRIPLLLSIPIP